MKKTFKFTSTYLPAILLLTNLSIASAKEQAFDYPIGQNPIAQFTSPNNVVEECMTIEKLPVGRYRESDLKDEINYCSIDLYAPDIALCPKTWSTSPGTMIYSVTGSGLTPSEYEAARCGSKDGHQKVAKFKNTMNASGTSGTYSISSTLYYHFSRYFNAQINVPVAVLRTIDKDVHLNRVSAKAVGTGAMNKAGWSILKAAEKNPAAYAPTNDLFTPDRKQIYGTLVGDSGERYGAEINGTRASGWGDGQNQDFQKTPGFLALRAELPIEDAIVRGLDQSKTDPLIRQALGSEPVSRTQMLFWMRELTEIVILDYMFNQQDRVGNIDYVWKWYYRDAQGVMTSEKEKVGKDVPRNRMASIAPPAALAPFQPILLQRTYVSDNDAGGRVQYTNFTKRTKMLEKIRHIGGDTYRQLILLAQDFKVRGPLYRHVSAKFGLTPKEVVSLVSNTSSAAAILNATCKSGLLQFDLNVARFFDGAMTKDTLNCDSP